MATLLNSFDKLLEIYPSAYTDEERAQTFLWYHLRKFSKKKTAHLKTIQRYFKKADRRIPTIEELRRAFTSDPAYKKMFPAGSSPDTFGYAEEYREWHDQNFGKCFQDTGILEKAEVSVSVTRAEHPLWFWLGVLGSIASIIGVALAIYPYALGNA